MAQRLAVILIPRFADWEHGFMTAPIRDFLGGEVRFYSPGGADMTSEGGMRARADGALEALTPDDFDALAVIGSGAWMAEGAPDIASLLQSADAAGRIIGLICGATQAGARAALLDARPHTSNDLATLQKVPTYRGAGHYLDVRHAVRAGNLITASGASSRSFAFEMVSALYPNEQTNLGYFRAELTAEQFT
jgi:putative intracellular protease/amidase